MHFEKHNVASAQATRGEAYCTGRTQPTAMRNSAYVGVRRNADDPPTVFISANLADDGGAVIAPIYMIISSSADQAALILQKIDMRELPPSLDVDDANVGALATW